MKIDSKVINNSSKFARNAVRKSVDPIKRALNKAGGVVKREAQKDAPSRRVANSLKVISKGSEEARVGLKKSSPGWYGKFYETGAKDHEIGPQNPDGYLAFTPGGKKNKVKSVSINGIKFKYRQVKKQSVVVKRVHHPGVKANPFLFPARDRKKPEVKEIIADAVVKIIQQSIKDV